MSMENANSRGSNGIVFVANTRGYDLEIEKKLKKIIFQDHLTPTVCLAGNIIGSESLDLIRNAFENIKKKYNQRKGYYDLDSACSLSSFYNQIFPSDDNHPTDIILNIIKENSFEDYYSHLDLTIQKVIIEECENSIISWIRLIKAMLGKGCQVFWIEGKSESVANYNGKKSKGGFDDISKQLDLMKQLREQFWMPCNQNAFTYVGGYLGKHETDQYQMFMLPYGKGIALNDQKIDNNKKNIFVCVDGSSAYYFHCFVVQGYGFFKDVQPKIYTGNHIEKQLNGQFLTMSDFQ